MKKHLVTIWYLNAGLGIATVVVNATTYSWYLWCRISNGPSKPLEPERRRLGFDTRKRKLTTRQTLAHPDQRSQLITLWFLFFALATCGVCVRLIIKSIGSMIHFLGVQAGLITGWMQNFSFARSGREAQETGSAKKENKCKACKS